MRSLRNNNVAAANRSRRSRKFIAVAMLGGLGLILLGVALSVSGKWAVDRTDTTEFCISCHEMRDNNYAEYKSTAHAVNRTGVKATCADCHVPHGLVAVAIRKIAASRDLYHHLRGTIDTKAKFEAHRTELAMRVWRHMKQTDSAECRHCHDVKAMDAEAQGTTARKQHQKIGKDGKTCIDCHYGIVHKEPAGVDPSDLVVGKQQ
jgi:cytochrome c-type protein NapC